MGWIHEDHPGHEGYVVGLSTRGGGVYRELGYAYSDTRPVPQTVEYVCVGCDCGWRSPRLQAPTGTRYEPFCVTLSEAAEERARHLWKEHIEMEADLPLERSL
jgi:hypothetical protein